MFRSLRDSPSWVKAHSTILAAAMPAMAIGMPKAAPARAPDPTAL